MWYRPESFIRKRVRSMWTWIAPLLLLFAAPVNGQETGLHPRVGTTIDAEERAYFNLFRMWPEGDVFVRQGDADSLEFVMDGTPSQTLTLSAAEAATIRTYIDRYEDSGFLRDSLNWQHAARVGRFGNRFRPPSRTHYAGVDGSLLKGILLHISNDTLVTLTGTDRYQWDHVASNVRRVDAQTLARIERSRPAWAVSNRLLLGLGFVFGSLIAVEPDLISTPPYPGDALSVGGILAASYGVVHWASSRKIFSIAGRSDRLQNALPGLANHTAFANEAIPPELSATSASDLSSLMPTEMSTDTASWAPARYISVGSEFLFSRSGTESYIGTGFGLLPAERRQAPFMTVDVSQDHSRRMAYGLEAVVSLPTSAEENQIDVSGQFVTVYASWYAARPDYLSFTNRWSLSAGVGVMVGRLVSTAPVSFTRQIVGLDPSLEGVDTIGQQATTVAGRLRVTAGYVIDQSSLLELRVTGMVPPLSLDRKERTFISSTLYTLDAISVPLGVSLGFKKRFVRGR